MSDAEAGNDRPKGDEILTCRAHGRSFRIHNTGGKVASHIQAGTVWEHPLLEHIHSCGFTGLAVDVGAHVGNHTLWLAAICGLQVVSFEPVKHSELARNIALNGLQQQVRVEPVSLGDTETHAAHDGKGRLTTGTGTLPVRRLDDYGLIDVALIKVDVEGMEPAVLRGGEHTIRRGRPVIFAEEWGSSEHAAIAAVLEPWGYRQTRRIEFAGTATVMGRWDG